MHMIYVFVISMLGVTGIIQSCPISIYNDTKEPIWVIYKPEVAERLPDTGITNTDIRRGLRGKTGGIRVVSGETETIGTPHTKQYAIYMVTQKDTFNKAYQLHITKCFITPKQRREWWQKNQLKVSQIQENKLTLAQKEHVQITSLKDLVRYKVKAAASRLLKRKFQQGN